MRGEKRSVKRRKLALLALVLALVLGLTGCGKSRVEVPDRYKDYVSPWEKDVVKAAQKDGKMHYYFMSAAGYRTNPGGISETKWGDSCLIVFPDGQTMLIDAGMWAHGPILVLNLQRMGIEKLDYFVLTHPHDDHGYGALYGTGVFASMEIGQVYHNGVINAGWSDPRMLTNVCAERGIPCDVLKWGDTLRIGEVEIQVLHPEGDKDETKIATKVADVNNGSLVMRFDYGEHSALFTGDIYKSAELELVKRCADLLDVDLLKLPHHGNDTSSGSGFVNAVSAELGVATGYEAVSIAAFSAYKAAKTTVLMDSEDGYIHVSAGRDGVLKYETSRQRSEKSRFGQLDNK
jgi:competence protein ComEC